MINTNVQIICVLVSFIVWKLIWKNTCKSQSTFWSVENGTPTTSGRFILEVSTGPSLAQGPYPALPAGRAWPEVCIQPCLRAGPAHERWFFQRAGLANEGWFFQRAGPGWHMRGDFSNGPGRTGTWEMIFRTGRVGPTKREMSFSTAESGYKKNENE